MRRLVLALALLLMAVLPSAAQQLTMQSVDPVGDSIAIADLRSRLAEIHRVRPTVALVLSGGGAKGAAIIGVLKELENLDIPVDMIAGTSIGGLVGSMYALGYKAEDVEDVFRNADWDVLLSDRVPQKYVSYARRRIKETYNLVTSFYYDDKFHFGQEDTLTMKSGVERVMASLPSGLVQGLNVGNLFSSLTVGYQDTLNFLDLPIPFMCVASDLVSCKAKNWSEGDLLTAMRSTMSIPLLFKPVRTDGMVLVDGGMRNNYPVDIAKAAGADYVIAVDLSDASLTFDEVHNVGDVVMQGVEMLMRESFEKNQALPDLTVKPNLEGYNMLSFSKEAIDTIMLRGQEATAARADELKALKARIPGGRELHNKPAVNISKTAVTISSVEFEGIDDADRHMLQRHVLHVHDGIKVGKEDIEEIVAAIYATDVFESVTYRLLGTEEPFRLVIDCKPGPIHQFALGARIDSEELVSLLINLGYNKYKLQGNKFDLTTRISSNPYVKAHYYNESPHRPTVNAEVNFRYTDFNLYHIGAAALAAKYVNSRQELYISNIKLIHLAFKMGLRNDFYSITSLKSDSNSDYSSYVGRHDYVTAFATGVLDTFDHGYYPSKGTRAKLDYNFVFAEAGQRLDPVHAISFSASKVFKTGERTALIPSFYVRSLFGKDIPFPYMNMLGGSIAGRYVDQQIPFMGINYASTGDRHVAVLDLNFRYKLAKNQYASLHGAYLKSDNLIIEQIKPSFPEHWGVALEYGYRTIFGPFRVNLHWSDLTRRVGLYASMGYDF